MAKLLVKDEIYCVREGVTVAEAASSSGLRPDSYIFLSGGTPVPMDTVITGDMEIRAIRVASGG
ncbi:MAG: hypothetical protein J5494_00020 [Candidatus Methanomethylophilaceae archaeon]|nr:hypothetical protein [Candidatus Methanomethylophilaceae archaeon]